ncbi:MAG TPA: glycosyltransferase [Nocardioides sp.]|uniref:glycosyltransferase n=1 Tax=Nocardioides sp. TaxID=35761 RepID=UPI002F42EC92
MTETQDRVVPHLSPPAALSGLAIYTMFRGPVAQLLQWCNFHLTVGAERLYVILDCPPTDLVSSLPDDPRIHWAPVDQATWDEFYPRSSQNVERKQVDGFRWMARQAAADGYQHLAFVDVDELIWLVEPFADLGSRSPEASAITLPVSEMWYSPGRIEPDPFAATLALSPTREHPLDLARAFGWRAQFLRRGFLGHEGGKTIYRLPVAEGAITVHQPVDGVVAERVVTLPRSQARLLHFDCGDVSTWNAKWTARLVGTTTAIGLAAQRQAQQQLFAHELRRSAAEQRRFFEEFFTLSSEAQQVLAGHSLLEQIDLGRLMSEPLHVSGDGAGSGGELIRLPQVHSRVDFQFAMVCDQRFVRPTFATMATVLSHMGERGTVRFVVLGDRLDDADVVHLKSLEYTRFDVEVLVYDITADLDRDIGTRDVKRATYGRIYLIDYLPEQRTIYLDGDILPTREFSELFALDLHGACLAGAPDSASLRLSTNPASVPIQQRNRLMGITAGNPLEYLNGGVLIFDLDNPDFRGLALRARSLVVLQGRALKQRDQDAINMAFAGRKYRLPSTYNYMTQFYVSDRCVDGELPRLKYEAADAVLVHFSGKVKPWEDVDDEFYNGLYRRLVLEAEERLGVTCGFYFSIPVSPPSRRWDAARWTDVLTSRPAAKAPPIADFELIDVSDDGLYVRVSPPLVELAEERGLRLLLRTGGKTLAESGFEVLGRPQADLVERVGVGVRKLPLDLVEALAAGGGVAQYAELVLARPDADPSTFARPVGQVDLIAAGPASRPDLLDDLGVTGRLERVSDGWLIGWYDGRGRGASDAVSMCYDGELAAQRPPDLLRPDLGRDNDGTRRPIGFRFRMANLARLGYGHGDGEVSVRVARTNIPLAGSPVPVAGASQELRYDAGAGQWVAQPQPRPPVMSRVRARVGRAIRR